ncbi:right-handed parallel beta-helix repeat-containing protein [bacterium]|nr:right-handed parallel beta-helix repeat-containing protein [bacterium]
MRASLPLLALALGLLAMPLPAAELFVSPSGNDANPGTLAKPFRTIGQAASVMQPGDTCRLRGGVYRETVRPASSGAEGEPLCFAAYKGEAVTVSGADPLTGAWTRHQGDIWKLATPLKFIQLFSDGKMLPEARWPNATSDDLMTFPRAAAGPGTDKFVLADPNLPPGDWNNALILIWPGDRWTSQMRRVTEYRPGQSFRFAEDFVREKADPYHQHDPYAPRPGNPYLLIGALAGVDSPGEWFLDEATGTLYLQVAPGDMPARHRIEAKQRDLAFDLSKLSCVEVHGLDIIGAAINMADAQHCLVEDCRLRYVQHVREWTKKVRPPTLNVMSGKGNVWRHCLIAYAALAAMQVTGEGNRVENCVIHDADYCGTGSGGLNAGRSVGAVVSHCSIFRTGRDIIPHHGSKRILLEYNDLYHGNMLNNDAGAIYCWGTDGEGGVIAHNWAHDLLGDATSGIYLDNFSKNFIVHHNVVWNTTACGIHINCDALNHLIANNTVALSNKPFGTFTYAAYTPTMKGTRILNNLVNAPLRPEDPSTFVQGELGPELQRNTFGAVDRDGVPVKGSAAIDAGIEIAGITDGFAGRAPDLGAYEFGGARWVAGADWRDPQAPPPPTHDLSFTPRTTLTESTMIREGLLVWLDAADAATLTTGADGAVAAWRSKGPGQLVALPRDPAQPPVRLAPNGLNGRAVVRGTGVGALRLTIPERAPGPLTVLVVSQAPEASGPAWQRIAAASRPTPKEWEAPNWTIVRRGGEKPQAYGPQVFSVQMRAGVLDRLTILGASESAGQNLYGDVAEVLIFGRALRFDEMLSVEQYLNRKWGLKR